MPMEAGWTLVFLVLLVLFILFGFCIVATNSKESLVQYKNQRQRTTIVKQ